MKRGLRENKEDLKEITWKGPNEGPELKLKGLGIRAQVPCTRKPMRSPFLLLLLFFIFFCDVFRVSHMRETFIVLFSLCYATLWKKKKKPLSFQALHESPLMCSWDLEIASWIGVWWEAKWGIPSIFLFYACVFSIIKIIELHIYFYNQPLKPLDPDQPIDPTFLSPTIPNPAIGSSNLNFNKCREP